MKEVYLNAYEMVVKTRQAIASRRRAAPRWDYLLKAELTRCAFDQITRGQILQFHFVVVDQCLQKLLVGAD